MNENETMQQETTEEPEHDAFLSGLMDDEEMEIPQREDETPTPEEPGEGGTEAEAEPEESDAEAESEEPEDEEQAEDEQQPAPQYVTLNFGGNKSEAKRS